MCEGGREPQEWKQKDAPHSARGPRCVRAAVLWGHSLENVAFMEGVDL